MKVHCTTFDPPCTSPQLGRDQEDAVYCENFALTVFNRADRVDRAGRADKATAMTFYAASYFMEVCVGACKAISWRCVWVHAQLFHGGVCGCM